MAEQGSGREWQIPWVNLGLFLATVVSTFYVGYGWCLPLWEDGQAPWYAGGLFAVPLLVILLFHEFGHYIAARRHRVESSLPYFIPLPMVFGTFGAIIRMRGRIACRNALLDIGAAGPLAGMAVALPTLAYGMTLSEVATLSPPDVEGPQVYLFEGHSLLYKLLLYVVHGPIPAGHDIFLHPLALAGWVGLFVTMLNLMPIGQLDGGHVAYALLGERQDRLSWYVLSSLPLLGCAVGGYFAFQAALAGTRGWALFAEALIGLNWFAWFGVLHLLRRLTSANHPPVDPGPLSPRRRIVAWLCLLIFALIFMPVPLRSVEIAVQ